MIIPYILTVKVDTNVYSVPPYDDCELTVVSRCVSCVAVIEETTTQKQTTTVEVSSAETTTETTALTTEIHVTPTVEVTSSDLHTTKSQFETTSTQKSTSQTSISQTETTSETDIFSTEQKEITIKNKGTCMNMIQALVNN